MSRPKAARHRIIEQHSVRAGKCSECGPVELIKYPSENNARCKNARQSRTTFHDGFSRPSLAERDKMIADQGGACVICLDKLVDPHIDHCHRTGRIRGVLCRDCNLGLGNFKDNAWRLERALYYLAPIDG